MTLEVARDIESVRAFLEPPRREGRRIGLVPTMGALHEGHLSLVRRAREDCDVVVVSIYVNPAQFAPHEDFDDYPRTFERDCALCETEGVDVIFCPTDALMYPEGYATYVEVEAMGKPLCGKSRPHFFRGVATVVLKLLNIVAPDVAYFGWKDAQQAAIIKRMVKDLNLPVEIVPLPTVREPDGLAMSSRNQYLGETARRQAPEIHTALHEARQAWEKDGVTDAAVLAKMVRDHIANRTSGEIDYVEVVSLDRIEPLDRVEPGNTLLAVAVLLEGTRLIDNIRL